MDFLFGLLALITRMHKGYIYVAMFFGMIVEVLKMRLRRRHVKSGPEILETFPA